MCKGTMQEAFSNFTANMNGCIIVIKNVPSQVCSQCGEVTYSDTVVQQLEQIVQRVRNSIAAEVAVINYSEKAA
jgi:YgiT-type zinc finger domain-containing protein